MGVTVGSHTMSHVRLTLEDYDTMVDEARNSE